MSRIGKKPVPVPAAVQVAVAGARVDVKGPLGQLTLSVHPAMTVVYDKKAGSIRVDRPAPGDGAAKTLNLRERQVRALHGLTRSLIANMVEGVTKGFSRALEIQGVGYKAEVKPFGVQLVVGFSHPVSYRAPPGVKITVENNVQVKIEGMDKEIVGQVAAELRAIRPPEPYKGKGIRYAGEQVRRKAGKTAQAAK
jgi:large subunit ribosomal protein L6